MLASSMAIIGTIFDRNEEETVSSLPLGHSMNQLTAAGLLRDEEPVPQQELREEVLRELDQILKSASFRKSPRGRQFLSHVVEQKLSGREDDLKEHTIGVEVFQRAPGYATGDDPVVRVQASDVRRRLEQYYQANSSSGTVR